MLSGVVIMNKAILAGEIGEVKYSHSNLGENYYKFDITVIRKSGNKDIIPCIIPGVYLDRIKSNKIELVGEIRGRTITNKDRRFSVTFMFVKDINEYVEDKNEVELIGYLCKPPVYRETPLGRQVGESVIASHRERSYVSDYIFCLTWGRNALRFNNLKVGDKISAKARFQSREYQKNEEVKTAYELSIHQFEVIYNERL